MKKNQTCTIAGGGNYLAGLILLAIVFAFCSCCASLDTTRASIKNCNCSQPDLATNSRNKIKESNKSTTKQTMLEFNKEKAGILETGNSVPVINVALPEQSTVNNNDLTNILPDDNMDVRRAGPAKYLGYNKGGPLGIKAVTTQLIAGPTVSSVNLKESGLTKKAGIGFQFGASLCYIFSEKFFVNPALLFSNNNFSTSSGSGNSSTKKKYSYSSLSAPVTVNFRANDRLSIGAGPEINCLLSATSRTNGEEKVKITDQSRRIGIGLEANVIYQVSKTIGIKLFVNKGMTNVNKTEERDYGYGGGTYNYGTNGKWVMIGLEMWLKLCGLMKGNVSVSL